MSPLLLTLLLDVAGLKPRALQERAVLVARDGDRAAVVDREGALWMGEGRLTRVASLEAVPSGLALGDELLLWRVEREGLWTRTRLEVRDAAGVVQLELERDGPALLASALERGFAIAFPGEVLLFGADEPRPVPIPLLSPEAMSTVGERLLVHGEGDEPVSIDLGTACARELPDEGEPLQRWLRARSRPGCGARRTLPPDVAIEAEEARQATIRAAVAARSPALLAGLGVRGRDAVLALAPKADRGSPRFTFLTGERLPGRPGTFGDKGAVLLQDFDEELEGWTEGPYAPACYAVLLLAPSRAVTAARMSQALAARARAGDACVGRVSLLGLGQLADTVDGSTIRYTSASGELLGRRVGPAGPGQVRLDIASLTPRGDPLTTLGQLPSLHPEWTIPAARAREFALDVDGSVLAAAGWELVRADPTGKRVARLSLPGPVAALSVRTNGSVDALVGGQKAVIDLDRKTARYYEAASPPVAAKPTRQAGSWAIDGRSVIKRGADGREGARLTPPVPVRDLASAGGGAVLETPLGLFGVDSEGELSWKLPDAGAWTVTRGVLVVSTTAGLSGYRLAR